MSYPGFAAFYLTVTRVHATIAPVRWALAFAAGCSFQQGSLGTGSAVASDADNGDSATDSLGVDAAPCGSSKVWLADFTADPTQQDLNVDATNDWAMRDSGAFPGTLAGGIWSQPGTPTRPLDTQPKQDFVTPTRVALRMRNTVRSGVFGALFWINVEYTVATFAPLYVNVQRTSNGAGQVVTLYNKTDAATEVALGTVTVTPFDFIDISLEIRPALNEVVFSVAGSSSTHTYSEIARNANDDRWATVVAYGADSEFDLARIEVCDP